MSIGVSGLMSGLDTKSIIGGLMELERRPIALLQRQEAAFQAKISAFGALRGALNELQGAAKGMADPAVFTTLAASSSRPELLTATASAGAQAGVYQLRVDALAQVQQLRSAAFGAANQVVGTGVLTLQVGSSAAVNVTIDASSNTLTGIAGAINQASTGVVAGVVSDGLGSHFLTLTSRQTGSSNTISLSMVDNDGNPNDALGLSALYTNPLAQTLTQTQAAANARLNINGINVERASNSIGDLITGLSLSLQSADPSRTLTLTVAHDKAAVSARVQSLVTTYNSVLGSLRELQAADPASGVVGPLQGDSAARLLNSRLQDFLFTQVAGLDPAVNSLSSLGLRLDRTGNLSFNAATFNAAYAANPTGVRNFFTQSTAGNEGLARRLDSFLDTYTRNVTGLLASEEQGLSQSISRIGEQVARLEDRISQREANLTRQFNNLELLLGQFQATSGVLTKQLDALRNLNQQISRR